MNVNIAQKLYGFIMDGWKIEETCRKRELYKHTNVKIKKIEYVCEWIEYKLLQIKKKSIRNSKREQHKKKSI